MMKRLFVSAKPLIVALFLAVSRGDLENARA